MNEVVVTLQNPIIYGTQTIDSLTLKGPMKVKHLKGLPVKMDYETMFTLVGRLSGHAPSVIDEINGEDIPTVLAAISDFLPLGPKTGD